MASPLIYGDSERNLDMRHAVPLAIIDPFLFVEHEGTPHVLTNVLERARIAEVLPGAVMLTGEELGFRDLLRAGTPYLEAELEVAARALKRWGVTEVSVPPELDVAVADRIRADGIELTVETKLFADRRRAKIPTELAGVRRAQKAAEAGMTAAERVIREAEIEGDRLVHGGEALTAERVRHALRAACAEAGAPAPPGIMVVSLLSGGGHDPGAGPLPANLPITIDLWPRDESSGCWADMTRTFVAGTISEEVARLHEVVLEAADAARAIAAPGVTGRQLYDAAADVIEAAGHPTQRSTPAGETLESGFYFSLGHGVGLQVHEEPSLGLGGIEELVPGDVIAIEPGVEAIENIGGVRVEDLLLITSDGCETLTDYPYDL